MIDKATLSISSEFRFWLSAWFELEDDRLLLNDSTCTVGTTNWSSILPCSKVSGCFFDFFFSLEITLILFKTFLAFLFPDFLCFTTVVKVSTSKDFGASKFNTTSFVCIGSSCSEGFVERDALTAVFDLFSWSSSMSLGVFLSIIPKYHSMNIVNIVVNLKVISFLIF